MEHPIFFTPLEEFAKENIRYPVFYQPHSFFTGQNIQVLRNKELSQELALFLVETIRKQMVKFNWGGNGATLGRLARLKIMLPVDKNGEPDFDYMESTIYELKKAKTIEYREFLKKELKSIRYVEIPKLDEKDWAAFHIVELFDKVQRGKRLKTEDHIVGNTPYISSTAINNGVDNFIGNKKNVRRYTHCLSLANSGSVGSCFYEPFEFIASDHVTHLKKNGINKYQYLFLSVMLNRLSEKYNFNREINDTRIKTEVIVLPVDGNGAPDYSYMEQYIKNIFYTKAKEYLDFKAR